MLCHESPFAGQFPETRELYARGLPPTESVGIRLRVGNLRDYSPLRFELIERERSLLIIPLKRQPDAAGHQRLESQTRRSAPLGRSLHNSWRKKRQSRQTLNVAPADAFTPRDFRQRTDSPRCQLLEPVARARDRLQQHEVGLARGRPIGRYRHLAFHDCLSKRRRYERQFRQAGDVAFGKSFAARDLSERTDATGCQLFEPSSSPCKGLQRRVLSGFAQIRTPRTSKPDTTPLPAGQLA